jgi:hypothetical protein
MSKPHETSPLFKADSATLSFYADKTGKLSVKLPGVLRSQGRAATTVPFSVLMELHSVLQW